MSVSFPARPWAVEWRLTWQRERGKPQARVYQHRTFAILRARRLMTDDRSLRNGRVAWLMLEQRQVGEWQLVRQEVEETFHDAEQIDRWWSR